MPLGIIEVPLQGILEELLSFCFLVPQQPDAMIHTHEQGQAQRQSEAIITVNSTPALASDQFDRYSQQGASFKLHHQYLCQLLSSAYITV